MKLKNRKSLHISLLMSPFPSARFSLIRLLSWDNKIVLAIVFFLLPYSSFSQSPWLDSLFAEKNLHDTIVLEEINARGRALIRSNPDSAIYYFQAAVDFSEASKSRERKITSQKASALRFIGIAHRQSGDNITAIDYYHRAIEAFSEIDAKNGVALCYRNIGNVYFYESDYPSATEYYKQALLIFYQIDDDEGRASIHNNMGNIYENQGNYELALENYYETLKISEELDNKGFQSVSHTNIGVIHYRQKNYKNAIEHFEKSFALKLELDDKRGAGILLINLSSVYFGQSELEDSQAEKERLINKAISSIEESIKIRNEINDVYGLSLCYNSLGEIYSKIGRFPLALDYLSRSLEISKSINNRRGMVFAYRNISELLYKQKDYYSSIDYSLKGLDIAKEIESLADQRAILFYLMQAYSAIGESEKLSQYLDTYRIVGDSLFSQSRAESIAEMETRYQTEKKEQEIELLSQEKELTELRITKTRRERNSFIISVAFLMILIALLYKFYHNRKKTGKILEVKNDELDKLNKTKDKFISILAHDLKNPFSSFLNITSTLNNDFDSLNNKDKKQCIEQLNQSAVQLNKLLKNMLEWAVIKHKSSVPVIETHNLYEISEESISAVAGFIAEKDFVIENNVAKDIFVKANKTHLVAILNNLITNAVKFSHKEKIVKVYATLNENNSKITVEDKGVGIVPEDIDKLFRIDVDTNTIGDSQGKGTGMGLILCKELVENMNGEIWVESKPGEGSKFIFMLPLAEMKADN